LESTHKFTRRYNPNTNIDGCGNHLTQTQELR
jgi:hypothetical protein